MAPVRLARRPASHPPDQRQDSAVTYVALCVVSAIAIEKRFFNYRATLRVACSSGRSASSLWRFASHNGFAMSVMLVYDSSHLFASRRPTLRDQSRQSPRSVSGPISSDSFALSLTSHSASSVPSRSKSAFVYVH
ncbi:Adenylyl- and sulfurtransferase ThiI [Pseudomonas syringae pv. actinidiae]|uniref:Adenylyl-and sulfurtransferase ThiI n=1 Tax=Pseudomonas syringae pv. actinidiae TaxID=103796 RepID=A0A2V0QGB1_PSESF|nr:Adenylyl- and sulfurtransferase ThiI [Pseudomonas syringae pv. actinidiae]